MDKEGRVALTHDAGGLNFDLTRKQNTCSKSFGYAQWSNTANAQKTKCLGLFELYDGSNRNHLFFDNGKFYYYDASLNPINVDAAAPVTFANDNEDLHSIIQVGGWVLFADRGETTPYKWKHGEANLSKFIQTGTEYKFRYIESFQRRVIGAYSDQTSGDIDIRWSDSWPATDIDSASMEFPAANQLYIPNDDSITGIQRMGWDRCYVYSESSIHALAYLPNYEFPFRLRNVINGQGFASHHSIVNLGDRHYGYNKNYGFCEFRGDTFPYGGRPISEAIESDLQDMHTGFVNLIVGTYYPFHREVVWTVPLGGGSTPDALLFYNIDTGQWRKEDKVMRYVYSWQMYSDFTWNDLITELGGSGAIWTDAGASTWAYYTSERNRLVYANTDGQLYYHTSEGIAGANLDGYRIEPILSFGDPKRYDKLQEVWFDIGYSGNFSIDVSWRGGNTVGEVNDASWISLGSISCNDNARPFLPVNRNQRLHQIKWGTDLKNEKFEVNGITFRYTQSSGTV
jgi:hypothetical protein